MRLQSDLSFMSEHSPLSSRQTFFVDDDIKDACVLDAVLTVVDTKHITQVGGSADLSSGHTLEHRDALLANLEGSP